MEETAIPGYKIVKRLGRGGMATVYLAVQETIKRKVALKIMSNQLGEDSVWAKRFIQEAQVIAQLTHPNVVPVYDVGTHDGQFYISMEYLGEGSLKERMKDGIALPDVLKIVAGVAAGLDYAGEKGFVHRDIKPDNIMFREDGSPVILDFGIVKQMDTESSGMTQTGVIVGTTSYMSPEQAQGRELDQRSDIYALGIMFFELLTGRTPFKGETDVATLLMHINEPVPGLPTALSVFQPIVEKALAKDPFHRYTRAREMIDHIQKLEPEIKEAIRNIRVGNSSDPTLVKSKKVSGDEDATMVLSQNTGGTTGATKQITSEDELTSVLSSAKATIQDFSAEARDRRARRTRNLIRTMAVVALIAVSYVGYQQLVVVPQERALAEAKIREAQLKTQKKIDSLLDEAKTERKGLLPTQLDKVDNVIAIYRQVLKLDPENEEAQFALEKFGGRYIEMAKTAVRRQNITKASTYRDYAEQLVPEHDELAALREDIKTLRSEQLDKEFKREEVQSLIDVAKKDIRSSEGFSDTAYTKLQQVLRLDSENIEATRLVDTMLQDLFDDTERDINRGRLAQARDNIKILERYYDDPSSLAKLESSLKGAQSSASKRSQILKLEKQADRLEREKRSIAVNDELRDVYLKIVRLDGNNRTAKLGLRGTSDYEADLAKAALEEGDFSRVEKQIDIIKEHTPKYAGLASLQASLARAKTAKKQSNELLQKAEASMQAQKSGDEKRKALSEAYTYIDRAKRLYANNEKIESTLLSLEDQYVAVIQQVIADDRNALLEAYDRDTKAQTWPSTRILELKQLAKKPAKKPKRVITGGF